MGKIITSMGGGSVDLSFITNTSSDILAEYIGTTIDAEILEGSMTNRGTISQSLNCDGSYTISSGYHNGSGVITANSLSSQTSADADAGNILASYTGWVNGSQVTGNMTNQGAKTSSLNASGSYTIPAGYHNGSGKITANTLASQTSGTATAAYILSGKTAWVGGSKLTGSLAVQNISSVSASATSSSTIRISWKNPAKGPYTGVKIFMSTSGNPGTGGTAKYTGTGSSTTASGTSYVDITGLSMSTTYYFTVCSYVTNIGNGTSYNINAKTTNYLYDHGNGVQWNAYTWYGQATDPVAFVKSDHLEVVASTIQYAYFDTKTTVPISSISNYTYCQLYGTDDAITGQASKWSYIGIFFIFTDSSTGKTYTTPTKYRALKMGDPPTKTTVNYEFTSDQKTNFTTYYSKYGYPKMRILVYDNYSAGSTSAKDRYGTSNVNIYRVNLA